MSTTSLLPDLFLQPPDHPRHEHESKTHWNEKQQLDIGFGHWRDLQSSIPKRRGEFRQPHWERKLLPIQEKPLSVRVKQSIHKGFLRGGGGGLGPLGKGIPQFRGALGCAVALTRARLRVSYLPRPSFGFRWECARRKQFGFPSRISGRPCRTGSKGSWVPGFKAGMGLRLSCLRVAA